MKDEDIIGKEFLTVRFEKEINGVLTCNATYDPYIGLIGVVTNIHENYPQYARVLFKDPKKYVGYITALHWPIKVIKEQLQENINKEKPEYITDLFEEIINLTKTK
jgi:hypothetical protein